MDLTHRFKEFIQQHDLFHQKDKLLLAVSGGVDSVVLCELCKQAGYDFSIADCNFRLRDKESVRDKEFVTGLANKYGVSFFLKEFDTQKYAKEKKLSIQEAARELRYDWFNELLTSDSPLLTPHYVLTAHHADDNIETLLMNFFRGTGLPGLAGIPLKSPSIHPISQWLSTARSLIDSIFPETRSHRSADCLLRRCSRASLACRLIPDRCCSAGFNGRRYKPWR